MIDLTWRPIVQSDLEAIVELAQLCYAADGGIGFMFQPDTVQSRFLPDGPGSGIGAVAADGRL